MPLSLTDRTAIVEAVRRLIRAFEGFLNPKEPITDAHWDKSDPDRARQYWEKRLLQAGKAVRHVLLPSIVKRYGSVPSELPGEADQYLDITGSQFDLREKAKLKELAKFCKYENLCYKQGIRSPEQAVVYLQGLLEEFTRRWAGGGEGEDDKTNVLDCDKVLANLEPAVRVAYFAFLYAEQKTRKRLTDREAYNWLMENGIPDDAPSVGELANYKLPSYAAFTRNCTEARAALGEPKHTRRGGRLTGKSVVKGSQIEPQHPEGK
jgi:hypothetical protein